MSRNISPDKAAALARAYTTNGWCKKKALVTAGYPEKYAKTSNAGKIFDNPVVRAEINNIVVRCDELVDVEISEIIQGLRMIAFPAEDVKVNNSDRNRALELLGKYKSMFADRYIFGIDEQERELSESQIAAADEIARFTNRESCKIHSGDNNG